MSILDLQQKHPKLCARIFQKGYLVGKSLVSEYPTNIDEPMTKIEFNVVLKDLKQSREAVGAARPYDPFRD